MSFHKVSPASGEMKNTHTHVVFDVITCTSIGCHGNQVKIDRKMKSQKKKNVVISTRREAALLEENADTRGWLVVLFIDFDETNKNATKSLNSS